MLYSFKELKSLANLEETTSLKDVVNAINSIGFEVEETYKFGDVKGIKFGKVLEVSKNPNSEKLTVAKIEFNDKERTIQTTANNVFVGMVVIAFVPGSSMGEIVFGTKEMAGIPSEGMLSSLNELGAPEELIRFSGGIQSYPNVDLSTDPIEYLGLQDQIIDVDILSNRSDANSYLVMARELSAYFGTSPLEMKINNPTRESSLKVDNGKSETLVMLEGFGELDISFKEQMLLAKNNIKSINNVIDLTNLTLIMTGQPTHAYDKAKVGNNFGVNLFSGNANIFGGKEIELKNNLVITSGGEPVSVAGVMGFEETGVSDSTKEFIIELGRFNIKDVRNSLKAIKVESKAGIQSSKNLGYGTIELALKYISTKLNDFSKCVNTKEVIDIQVPFDTSKISDLAGFDITKDKKYEQAINSLEILGFKFLGDKVLVPSYRHDVKHQQDLNEEIFRFYGYDNFRPEPPKGAPAKVVEIKNLKSAIASQGYTEVTTYSLTSNKKNIVNPFQFKKAIQLETFVSKEREEIRFSQAISLLEIIQYNQKRKMNDISLFSYGMIGEGEQSIILASTTKTFNEMKNNLKNLINEEIEFVRTKNKDLHPGTSAMIVSKGKVVGWLGKVHPSLTKIDVIIGEFFQDAVLSKQNIQNYNSEPLKSRDFTFELKKHEDLSSKMPKIGAYEIKVIDKFVKDDINKITVRFTGTREVIDDLDNLLN